MNRRAFFRAGASAAVGLVVARPALAGPDDDEPSAEVKRVLDAHFGARALTKGHVKFDIPENAPDGRAVPVFIETDIEPTAERYVKAFHVVVDHNPDIYLAGFEMSAAAGAAAIDTRIKMRRTSYVRAIAEMSTGELFVSAKKVFVTLNGCG
jgi:sulfur-oxidizing protein SoxY